jgi:hypothetical protein
LGGLAPIAGGVVFAVYGSLVGVFFIMFLLSVLVVIVALHLLQRQRQRYGLAGAIVSATAFLGVALIVAASILNFDGLGVTLLFVGVFVAPLGIMLLTLVTFSVGVLPWWGGVALIAGNPILGLFFILIFIGSYPHLGGWLVAVPWIVVGFAVVLAAGWQPEQPSRVQ